MSSLLTVVACLILSGTVRVSCEMTFSPTLVTSHARFLFFFRLPRLKLLASSLRSFFALNLGWFSANSVDISRFAAHAFGLSSYSFESPRCVLTLLQELTSQFLHVEIIWSSI